MSLLNKTIYARTMAGVITISDGTLTIENGNITNANNINTSSIKTSYLQTELLDISTNVLIEGNLTVNKNFVCGISASSIQTIKGKMTFVDTLPECGLAPSTASQLTNKNYTDTNYVYKTGSISETITGVKTFSVPPENSSTITTNSQLTNKLYVDTKFNSIDLSNYVTLNTTQSITGTKTYSGNNNYNGANTFTNDGNTFNTTSSNFTLQNQFFTAFTGFTAPVNPTLTYLISGGTATGTTTISNWTWNRGNTNCEVVWSNGNNGLEYYGPTAPGYSYLIFNRAIAGSSFYMQQSGLTFTAGKQYIMRFWSYYGWVNANLGGSKTGIVTVSIGTSSDTYVYNDQDTRVALSWRQHIFRFSVNSTSSTFLRFTATDTATAGQPFPFAIAGITIREYSSIKLTDTSQSLNSFTSGDFSLYRNLFTQNLYGSGDFGTSSGRGNFFCPTPNINCLAINNTTFTNGTNYNSIAIGKAAYFYANGCSDCINIGNYQNLQSDITQVSRVGNQMVQIGNNQEGSSNPGSILIGHYIRQLRATTGYSVAIGNQIGADSNGNNLNGYGVGSRTVAIGHGIFSGQSDPFNRPSPDYSVMIGYLTGRNNGDYYNVGIGSYALNSMNGAAGAVPWFGSTQYNTAIGYQSARNQTDLNRCTFLGANTDNTANNLTDTIAIGYGATCGNSFSVSIGSGVSNNIANSVRIGRSRDIVQIDGSLNVIGKLLFPSNSISDSFLSTNIPLKNGTNTFSALNTFTGGITATATQTISFGTNAPTMSGANISNASIPDSALSSNVPLENATNTFTALNTFTTPLITYKYVNTITAIGHQVLNNGSSTNAIGQNSVFIGNNAGYSLNNTNNNNNNNNCFIGSGAGYSITHANNVTLIGSSAGADLTGASLNINIVAIGSNALGIIKRCEYSVNIGSYCLNGPITNLFDWNKNTLIGSWIFTGNDCGVNQETVMIGYGVGSANNNTSTINRNVVIGNSGYVNGNYSNSVAISGYIPIINASNTFYVGDDTYTYNTVLNNREYPLRSQNSVINSATTLTFPVYEYYSVSATSTFNITLPTIQAKDLGTRIIFRRVGGTVTIAVTFQGNGTQKVYNTALTGGTAAQTLMASSIYRVCLVALVDGTAGTFGWFQE